MKLPGSVQAGVQSLGRPADPSDATAANARMVAQTAQALGSAFDRALNERVASQTRDANLNMSRSEIDFDAQYGDRDNLDFSEVPEGVEARKTEKQLVDGELIEQDRTDIPAYEVTPEIYRDQMLKRAEAESERIIEKNAREDWLLNAQNNIEDQYNKRKSDSLKQQAAYERRRLAADIEDELNEGRFGSALSLATYIKDPIEKKEVKQQIEQKQEVDAYDTMILESDNPEVWEDMAAAVQFLREPDNDSTLVTQQRIDKANQLERALMNGRQQFANNIKQNNADVVADIEIQINRGSTAYTQSEFEMMRNGGMMSNAKYVQLTGKLDDNIEQQQIRLDADAVVASAVSGTGMVNPQDKNQLDAVDRKFSEWSQQDGSWNAAVRSAQTFNVLPSAAKNLFYGANSSNVATVVEAGKRFNEINSANPNATGDLKDVDRVRLTASLLKMGLSDAEVGNIIAQNDNLTPQQRQTAKDVFKSKDVREDSAKVLADKFDEKFGTFFTTPEMPLNMTTEYDALVELNLPVANYNLEAAQTMAADQIFGRYKVTEINGERQVMAYMPDVPETLLRGQIKRQLGDDVIIQSDQMTALQAQMGEPLSYQAFRQDDDGNVELLDRYKLDLDEIIDEQNKEMQRNAEESLRKAQALREGREEKRSRPGIYASPKEWELYAESPERWRQYKYGE